MERHVMSGLVRDAAVFEIHPTSKEDLVNGFEQRRAMIQ